MMVMLVKISGDGAGDYDDDIFKLIYQFRVNYSLLSIWSVIYVFH